MKYSYILFRCKQIGRFFQQTGIHYILAILFLLSGALLQGVENLSRLSNLSLTSIYFFIVLAILVQRTDYNFLMHTDQRLSFIYLQDIGLLTSVLSIPVAILGEWKLLISMIGLGIGMAFLWPLLALVLNTYELKKSSLKIDIPYASFIEIELRYLIRKYGLFLSLIYTVCFFFVWHPASVFVFAFILIAIFQSTLEFFEPKEMIFYHFSPRQFLHNKILRLWISLQILLLPFYLIGISLSFEYWYLYALVFVASTVMIVFSICNKYVFYRPTYSKYKTNVLAGIMLLFMLIPGFQLVVLFMSVLQYFKAVKNLKYYW